MRLLAICLALCAGPVFADTTELGDYLESMDRTEVTFSGRIKYDSREDSFTFYDENRDLFRVTVDAGRDVRERIEEECDAPGMFISYAELCTITGSGTVEIRGSMIHISIAQLDQLGM